MDDELRRYLHTISWSDSDDDIPHTTNNFSCVISPESFECNLDEFDNETINNSPTSYKTSNTVPVSQDDTNANLRRSQRNTHKKTWTDCKTSYSSDSDNQSDSSYEYDKNSNKRNKNYKVTPNHKHGARHQETDKEYCINLFEQGWSVQNIYDETKISKSTLHYWNREQRKKGLLIRKTLHSNRYY